MTSSYLKYVEKRKEQAFKKLKAFIEENGSQRANKCLSTPF